MDTGDKIKYLRKKLALTLEQVGKYVGVSKATVLKWETGMIQNMRRDKIAKLAEILHTTPEYLINDEVDDAAISRAFNVVPTGRMGLRPIYGSISAGLGEFVTDSDEILGWEPVEEKYATDDYFYLRVKGDSMSPKIEDGDLLLIRKQDSVDSGDIGAFLVDGDEGFVKRVKYDTDYITFISLNPAYVPITFIGAEVQRVRVVGKVMKIVKNLY